MHHKLHVTKFYSATQGLMCYQVYEGDKFLASIFKSEDFDESKAAHIVLQTAREMILRFGPASFEIDYTVRFQRGGNDLSCTPEKV